MEGKWEGKLSIEIPSITADQAWDCLKDFCNIHKWFTTLDTCYQVEGVEGVAGEPGLVRYCAASTLDGNGGTIVLWANEKLLTMNSIERVVSYEITENNMGLKSYNATKQVSQVEQGCRIEWSFISDPIQGQKLEEFTAYVDGSLKCIAKNIQEAFSPAVLSDISR